MTLPDRFDVDFLGQPAGEALIREFSDGLFGWAWERPDGEVSCGLPYASELSAAEALMDALMATVVAWYGGVQ